MMHPLGFLLTLPYRLALALTRVLRPKRSSVPESFSICVGNLTAGGSGKTPLVIHLCRFLSGDRRVAVLTRGYGRRSKEMIVLSSGAVASPQEAGDEASLIFRKLGGEVPVLIHKDRVRTAGIAYRDLSTDVVILDDGFQYRRFQPHLSILLLDHRDLLRGERLPPLGLWREPLSAAKRADILGINFKTSDPYDLPLPRFLRGKPCFRMRYIIEGFLDREGVLHPLEEVRSRSTVAFSGIADPKSFHRALLQERIPVLGFKRYLDHHFYDEKDLVRIEILREETGASLVLTTEKDLIRIPDPPAHWLALSIRVEVEDEERLLRTIREALSLHEGQGEDSQGEEEQIR
jgi:tetraacyldisaccharide 4'-kinase